MQTLQTLGLLQNIGTVEWIVLLALGLLIFGRRLPEVGRSLGRGIVEFRKGLKGIEDEVEGSTNAPRQQQQRSLPPEQPAAPLTAAPGSGAGAVTAPDLRVSRADTVE